MDNSHMLEKADEIYLLLVKHLKNEQSPEDRQALNSWVNYSAENKRFFDEMTDGKSLEQFERSYIEYLEITGRTPDFSIVMGPAKVVSLKRKRPLIYIAVAASILAFFLIGGFFLIRRTPKQPQVAGITTSNGNNKVEILPGGNKATLTLSNGQAIILDTSANGKLAKLENVTINNQEGRIEYNASHLPAEALAKGGAPISFNTLSTPRGGQYQLTLSDGTKVWLNAATSLTFPTAFTGTERKVVLRGEAYFEVVKDKSKPFKVELPKSSGKSVMKGGEVEVLGTHFNINNYEEETAARTTLLEGSIRFTPIGQSLRPKLLTPGQQAILTDRQLTVELKNDPEATIAWLKGKFSFQAAGIKEVMLQLGRWYDVQIVYEGNVPDERITGKVDRTMTLSKLLKNLEGMCPVHFKIDNKTIKVLP